MRWAPVSLSKAEKEALCSGNHAPGAGACAKLGLKKKGGTKVLGKDGVIALCRTAMSAAPARCGMAAKGSKELIIGICKGAVDDAASAPAMCASHVDEEVAAQLCAGVQTSAPGECFAALDWPNHLRFEVCRGATSGGPAQCAKQLQHVDPQIVADLCRGATDTVPVQCFQRYPGEGGALACAMATSVYPATCARRLQRHFTKREDDDLIARFCRRATEEATACAVVARPRTTLQHILLNECGGAMQAPPPSSSKKAAAAGDHGSKKKQKNDDEACFKSARGFPEAMKRELCTAGPRAPRCAKAAPYAMAAPAKVALCRRELHSDAAAEGRGQCAARAMALPRMVTTRDDQSNFAASLCGAARDVAPAACAEAAPKDWSLSAVRNLCESTFLEEDDSEFTAASCAVEVIKGLRQRRIDPDEIATLCGGATTRALASAVVDCALGIGDVNDRVTRLCGARRRTPTILRSSLACYRSLPPQVKPQTRFALCEDAEGPGPGLCFVAARELRLKEEDAVSLCHRARDATPAYCARRRPSEDCHAAVSIPSDLVVKRLEYAGSEKKGPLRPDQNFRAELEIVDQYGQVRRQDNDTSVVASIPLDRSHGATLDGRRVNVSVAGVVTFDYLRLSQAGTFSLRFRLGDSSEVTAGAFVRVAEDPDSSSSPAGRCGGHLLARLRCLPSLQKASPTALVTGLLPPASFIRGPLAGCLDKLHTAGFTIAPAWHGMSWVAVRRGLAWIEAIHHPSLCLEHDRHIPSADMPPTTRLQVHHDADPSTIRKAYHRLSLEWHPDRWLAFPLYASHVHAIFAHIGDAYTSLLRNSSSRSSS